MPKAYTQLLDAAIQHLEGLKERGVQFMPVSPETLAALNQPQRMSASPEPRSDRNGPLSLSLSPSEGERVPKAGEGLVHGANARHDIVEASQPEDWLTFAVWLGVLGWALHSFAEFGLYVPALAWTAFAFLGWLLGREYPFDKTGQPR